MGKLGCPCGHTIVDQADGLRYKGYILPDTLLGQTSEKLTVTIDSILNAENKSVPSYATSLPESSMIHDLLSAFLINIKQDIFECENCGRIAIQVGQTEHFKFFIPDSENTKGILNPGKVKGEDPGPKR